MEELERDFLDTSQEYTLDGAPRGIWPKPKSAGFVVMATLLDSSRSRLIECLLQLLHELESNPLDNSRRDEAITISATAVELLTRARADKSGPHQADLTSIGLERNECDGAHWREVALTQTVALLYECALREEAFLERATRGPLTSFSPEAVRLECTPVLLQPLSRVLAWTPRFSPLALLANTMSIRPCSSLAYPSVPLMAVGTLEHVARYHPLRENMLSTTEGLLSFLTCCVDAIAQADKVPDSFELTPRGYDVLSSSHRLIATDSFDLREVPYTYNLTVRGAVLSFLLAALSPKNLSLSHYLLGLDGVVMTTINGGGVSDPLAAGKLLRSPVPGAPLNCLEAVIDMLLSAGENVNNVDPWDRCKAMELLFRISCDSWTSLQVLGLLRKKSVNFLCRQLHSFSLLLNNFHHLPHPDFLLSCLSWLLRICALEIHVTKNTHTFARSQALLEQLFYSNGSNLLFSLMSKALSANVVLGSLITSQDATESLRKCQISFSPSTSMIKGVNGAFGDPSNEPPAMCYYILTNQLRGQLADGVDRGFSVDLLVKQAEEMNKFSTISSASAHLAMAVRQVVEVHLINETIFNNLGHGAALYQSTLTALLLPLLHQLIGSLHLEMPVLEQIARAFLSAITFTRRILDMGDESFYMPGEDFDLLLNGLLQALIRRSHENISPSSSLYRGLLSCGLIHLIHMGENREDDYNKIIRVTIQPRVVEIVEIQCRLSLSGPWKCTALAALSLLTSILRGDSSDANLTLTPSFLQLLEIMSSKGHLMRLIGHLRINTHDSSTFSSEFFSAVVNLFTELAMVPEGASVLLQAGIQDVLSNLSCFEGLNFSRTLASESSDSSRVFFPLFLLMLHFQRCLLVSVPAKVTADGALNFILRNRGVILSSLRIRDFSFMQLQLAECVCSLFATLGTLVPLETALFSWIDVLIVDICALLRLLGDPPAAQPDGGSEGWWHKVRIGIEEEIRSRGEVPIEDVKAMEGQAVYLGHRVMISCATFLRCCCAQPLTSISVDFDTLAEVFVSCSRYLRPSGHNIDNWLVSSQALITTAEVLRDEEYDAVVAMIAESLMCAMYDMIYNSLGDRLASFSRNANHVIAASQESHHSPHSMIRFVGSRMEQLVLKKLP